MTNWMDRNWEIHEWSDEDKERFLVKIAAMKAKHRANGCIVFDDMIARCTCPKTDDDD